MVNIRNLQCGILHRGLRFPCLLGHLALEAKAYARGLAPEAIEAIEVANLGLEDVCYHRTIVDEHPVGPGTTLNGQRLLATVGGRLAAVQMRK